MSERERIWDIYRINSDAHYPLKHSREHYEGDMETTSAMALHVMLRDR